MDNLKNRIIRSGAINLFGQFANLLLRLGYLAIMARLLEPSDYGLVAMVVVVTSFLDVFTSGGLSVATIQKAEITDGQISTLFWINILIGFGLALLCVASAPILVALYREPRVFWIAIVMAISFLLNASAIQHNALLQRRLRYATLASIDVTSQVVGFGTGIVLASMGCGYWSLISATILASSVNAVCTWLTVGWIPSLPQRGAGVRAMLSFGGTVTLNRLIMYVGNNTEKVLLGRFWGADVLGLYGRAYQVLNLPMSSIHSAVGSVAFSALSRFQDDPPRFRLLLLRGYALTLSITTL